MRNRLKKSSGYDALLGRWNYIIVFLIGCALSIIIVFSSAQEVTAREISAQQGEVIFAFYNKLLSEADMKDAKSAINYWMRVFAAKMNVKLRAQIYDNLDSLKDDFGNGSVDWASMGPGEYMSIRDSLNAELCPAPIQGGKKTRNYQLIVRSDSRISKMDDLKGKVLAITRDDGVGKIYMNSLLLQSNQSEIGDFFSSTQEKRMFFQVVLAVFFGQADAGMTTDYAFDTLAELNPQIRNQLTVFAASLPIIHAVSIVRKDLDAEVKNRIMDVVSHLDESADGKQVLMLFKIDRMVPIHESDIATIEELYSRYKDLKFKSDRQKAEKGRDK